MASGRCVIIGAGSIGRQLIRLLPRELEITCVDLLPENLAAVREGRGDDLQVFQGDATSRLVLAEVGVESAEIVVITTTSEKISIEVARLLKEHFTVRRVLSVGITPRGIEALAEMGVEVVGIFDLAATGLRNRLEQKTKAVQGIGLGKNEILEVEVHPHSRLANKPLAALNPKSWRVGIIYRDGNIVVPGGDTTLRPKDRVILLGDPKVLKTVTDLLTFRFTHFPREYGDTLAVYCGSREDPRYLEEIAYLLSVFPMEKGLFLLDRRAKPLEETLQGFREAHHLREVQVEYVTAPGPFDGIRAAVQGRVRRIGMLVLPRALIRSRWFSGAAKRFLQETARLTGCPLLLAAGSFPYRQVAVPCVLKEGLEHAMETTLEMSAALKYRIEALYVSLSPYIATEEETRTFTDIRKGISDLGLVYKTPIHDIELRGNPIEVTVAALAERDLAVMEIGSWRPGWEWALSLRPDIGWEIVRQSSISTLLAPPTEIIP